jgi:hypothetical protein
MIDKRETDGTQGGVSVAEIEPKKEVRWGHKNICELPLDCIVTFDQVREDADSGDMASLVESIEKGDLINQIDVARMDRDALQEYAAFVNKLWGAHQNVDDCPVGPDGKYYLCIAGHRRTKGLRIIAAKNPDTINLVDCKVHDTPTPLEIMSLQLNENIYHEPSKERQAMAIVETYFFGLEKGLWRDQREFLKKNKDNFSHNALINALHFAKLPPQIREFVTINDTPYEVAVEMGKAVDPLRIYFSRTILGNKEAYKRLTEEQHKSKIDEAVLTWLGSTIAHTHNENMKKSKAKQHVRGFTKHYRELNAAAAQGRILKFELDGPERELALMTRQKQREYEQALYQLSDGPIQTYETALKLHARILPQGDQLLFAIGERLKSRVANMGGTAMEVGGLVIAEE